MIDAKPLELMGYQQAYRYRDIQDIAGHHELVTALKRGWHLEKAWPLPANVYRRVEYYNKRIRSLSAIKAQLKTNHVLYKRVEAWLNYTIWNMIWLTHDIGVPSTYGVNKIFDIVSPERTPYPQRIYPHKNILLQLFRTPERVEHDHALPYWLHEYSWWFQKHIQCAYFVQHALWCCEIIKCMHSYLAKSNMAHIQYRDMDIAKIWYAKWIRGREHTQGKSNAHWVTPETLHAQHVEEWKWIERVYDHRAKLLGADATNADSACAWLCLKTLQLWNRYDPEDAVWMQQYDSLVGTGETLLAPFALDCVTDH